MLEAMQKESGRTLTELRVDGGATANDLLMQIQADLLAVPVVRPRVLETTALGGGLLGRIDGGTVEVARRDRGEVGSRTGGSSRGWRLGSGRS